MKILITLTILVSLALFSCKDKITTPEEKAPIVKTDYFPLAVGNSWRYNYSSNWGYNFSGDSSRGTIQWLITAYNAGVYTVKEVKADLLKDTTFINYFTITQLDSTQIKIWYNTTISSWYDTLVRYHNPTDPDTVNISYHAWYQNHDYLLQLKKSVGIVYYYHVYGDQGEWGSDKVELISALLPKN
jgi:hypothetical protein